MSEDWDPTPAELANYDYLKKQKVDIEKQRQAMADFGECCITLSCRLKFVAFVTHFAAFLLSLQRPNVKKRVRRNQTAIENERKRCVERVWARQRFSVFPCADCVVQRLKELDDDDDNSEIVALYEEVYGEKSKKVGVLCGVTLDEMTVGFFFFFLVCLRADADFVT